MRTPFSPTVETPSSMKRMGHLMLVAVLSGSLAGCSMAPSYSRPESPVSEAWPDGYMPDGKPLAETTSASASDIGWRSFFPDQHLQKLIELAIANNRDLRVSALNMERARGLYGIQRAEQLPGIEATGQSSNQGVPASISPSGKDSVSRQYSAGVGISGYELDFFGRIQSLKEQALEQYLATEEALRSARLSLVAEVATMYLSLVADRESLSLSSDTLVSQQASYDMIKRRHEVGVSSELDLWQAQTSVDTAKVNIALYTGRVAQGMAALSLLVGAPVTPAMLPAERLQDIAPWNPVPVGVPSQVLLQRPDIVQAEHLLKAANANIGAARANFFPRISLSTSVGFASRELSSLFDGGTGTWSFLPQISLPLFEGGRNVATLKVSEADKAIAVASYERAIQRAFQEVSDALILRRTLDDQVTAQESLTQAAQESYRLSQERYTQGVDSYLSVLDSQRFLFNAQLGLVSIRTSRAHNSIQLYKVLGGGWKE